MKKISEITITFENCEWMTFKAEDIKYFEIFGLNTNYTPYDLHQYSSIKEFILGVSKNADLSLSGLQNQEESQNSLVRLNYKDVTHIDIDHEDGTALKLYVDWCNDHDESKMVNDVQSDFQKVKLSESSIYIYQSLNGEVEKWVNLAIEQENADSNF